MKGNTIRRKMINNGGYGFGPSMRNPSKKKDPTKRMKKCLKQLKKTREHYRVLMGIKYKNDNEQDDGNAAKRDTKNKVVAQKTRQTPLEEPRVVPLENNLTCLSRPNNDMPSSSKLIPKITKKSTPSSSKPNNGVPSFRGTTKSSSRPTNDIDSSNKNVNGCTPPLRKVEKPRTSYARLNDGGSSLTKNTVMSRSSSLRPKNERVSPSMNIKKSMALSKPNSGLVRSGKNDKSSSSKPNNGVVSFRGTTESSSRPTNGIDSSKKNANGGAPPLRKVEKPRASCTRLNNGGSSLTKNTDMPSSSSLRPNNERVSPPMNIKKSMSLSKPNSGLVRSGKNDESLKSRPSLPRSEFSSVLKGDSNPSSSFGSLKESNPSSIFGISRITLQNVNGEAQKESIDEHIQLDGRKRKSGLSEDEGTNVEKLKNTRMKSMDCSIQLENRNSSLVEDGRTIDDKLRKRTEALSQENPETHEDDDSEEGENRRPTKRRRKLILNDYEDDDGGEHNLASVVIDTAGLTTQTAVVKDSPIIVSKPFLSESLKLQQYGSLPIDEPVWSGLIKISSKENVSLAAHLSTKCCEKVWKLAGSLQPEIVVTKLSRMEAWPKSFEASGPTDNNIALYFLPCQMRQDADLDQLVKEVAENDMVLQAAIGEAEMLIFPSVLLPEQHQTFQEKPYLWAVFRHRKNKVTTAEAQPHGKELCPQNEMGKQQASHCSVGRQVHRVTGLNMDGGLGAPEELGMEREQNPSVARTNTPSPANKAPTMNATTSANNPSLAVPTGAFFGFVVQSNLRVEQLIQEMQREGAVMVAMRGEMIGSGLGQGTTSATEQDKTPLSSS